MPELLDANAILRYLLNDIEEQTLQSKEVIEAGAFTIPEVLAEVVYVLRGVYQVKREEIRNALTLLLEEIDIQDRAIYRKALSLYSDNSPDYVDCVLIARSELKGERIFSFDKKLKKELIKPQ